MAKCVGSVSYCALYELISTNQALEFREMKFPFEKCCHRYRLNFSNVVFIVQQTECSS